MTLVIDLPPELEGKLREASARSKLPMAEYVRLAVEERLQGEPGEAPFWQTARPDEWEREFLAWAESHRDVPILSDEAISRESIYEGRY